MYIWVLIGIYMPDATILFSSTCTPDNPVHSQCSLTINAGKFHPNNNDLQMMKCLWGGGSFQQPTNGKPATNKRHSSADGVPSSKERRMARTLCSLGQFQGCSSCSFGEQRSVGKLLINKERLVVKWPIYWSRNKINWELALFFGRNIL